MLLSKDQILAADDLPFEDVEIPQWGGSVRVRAMTGQEKDAFELSILREKKDGTYEMNQENFRAKLLASTLVGEDGKPLFCVEEAALLGGKSSKALDVAFQVAKRLNAIGEEEQAKTEKN